MLSSVGKGLVDPIELVFRRFAVNLHIGRKGDEGPSEDSAFFTITELFEGSVVAVDDSDWAEEEVCGVGMFEEDPKLLLGEQTLGHVLQDPELTFVVDVGDHLYLQKRAIFTAQRGNCQGVKVPRPGLLVTISRALNVFGM